MTDEAMRALVDDIAFALDGRHNWLDIDDARHRILGTVVDKAFLRWLRAALSTPAGLDAAWAEAEAAIPRDMPNLRAISLSERDGQWTASTVIGRRDGDPSGVAHYERHSGTGVDPAAALRALAELVRED